MGRIHEYLATLSILLARVVLLENGEIYMKRFRGLWFMVCEFRGFKNVLHDVCILRHPYIESSDYLLYKWCLVQSLVFMIFQCILGNTISIIFCTSNYKHVHSR